MLVDGVTVEYRTTEGEIRGAQIDVIDFGDAGNNDWLAVNQFTVVEQRHQRRPDIVLFVNGLPLAIVELKNAADEDATVWSAYEQIQTYKAQIPSIFATNELIVISDGVQARVGTLTAGREWFKPWRTISGIGLRMPCCRNSRSSSKASSTNGDSSICSAISSCSRATVATHQ